MGATGVVAAPDTKVFPQGLLDDVKSFKSRDYSEVTFNTLCALSVLYPLKTNDEIKLREYHYTIEFFP